MAGHRLRFYHCQILFVVYASQVARNMKQRSCLAVCIPLELVANARRVLQRS